MIDSWHLQYAIGIIYQYPGFAILIIVSQIIAINATIVLLYEKTHPFVFFFIHQVNFYGVLLTALIWQTVIIYSLNEYVYIYIYIHT